MQLSLEYIACFLDTEGNITAYLQKQKNPANFPALGIDVRFYNQHLGVLEMIRERIGEGRIRTNVTGFSGVYVLEFGRVASQRLLRMLLPYLVIKREQAVLALEAIARGDSHKWQRVTEEIHTYRKWVVQRMSELNKAGGKAFRTKWINSVNLSVVPDIAAETIPSQAATGTDDEDRS